MYVFHPMTMCVMACEYVGVQPLSHQGCNYGAHSPQVPSQQPGSSSSTKASPPGGSTQRLPAAPAPQIQRFQLGLATSHGKAPQPLPGSEGALSCHPARELPHPRALVHWELGSRVGPWN